MIVLPSRQTMPNTRERADRPRARASAIVVAALSEKKPFSVLGQIPEIQVVGIAENQREGIALLTAGVVPWDVVFIDIALKAGNGLQVLGALWSRDNTQKAVMLGQQVRPQTRRRCEELGADAVFDLTHEQDALVTFCLHHARSQDPRFSSTPTVSDAYRMRPSN